MAKNILVTGGNKGIGYEICKQLVEKSNVNVILGSRNSERGTEAVEKIKATATLGSNSSLTSCVVDLDDHKTIDGAGTFVAEHNLTPIDVLVNNAGMAFKGDAFDENVVEQTNKTNYYGLKKICATFIPLLRPGGRIVNVSSIMSQFTLGKYMSAERRDQFLAEDLTVEKLDGLLEEFKNDVASKYMSAERRDQFLAEDLTVEKLDGLLEEFKNDVASKDWKQKGWPTNSYGMSKVGVSMYTRLLAAEHKDFLINACCPGFVKTDMSSNRGFRSPEKGAETPVFLAIGDLDGVTGEFWSDKKIQPWFLGSYVRHYCNIL